MGLMQIMPGTWAELRQRYGLGADPYDPHDNVMAGTAYLRELHDRFGEPWFLAAYNAGPGRYEEHLATGRPLPSETVSYMAAVASLMDGTWTGHCPAAASSWHLRSLFVARGEQRLSRRPSQPSSLQSCSIRSTMPRKSDTAALDAAAPRDYSPGHPVGDDGHDLAAAPHRALAGYGACLSVRATVAEESQPSDGEIKAHARNAVSL